jgi:transposase
MDSIHYVGMDVHNKFVQFCVKDASGKIEQKGRVDARHAALKQWAGQLARPWVGGMEARCSARGFTMSSNHLRCEWRWATPD